MKNFENFNNEENGIKYLCGCGVVCPVCLNDETVDVNRRQYESQTCYCNKCDFDWTIWYDLEIIDVYDEEENTIIEGNPIPEITTILKHDEIDKKYLNNGKDACPYCGSKDIDADDTHSEGDMVYETMICEDCDFKWTQKKEYIQNKCIDLDANKINKGKYFLNIRKQYNDNHFTKLKTINKDTELNHDLNKFNI